MVNRWEVRLFGFGGQGIIRGGQIIGEAAVLYENKDATLMIAYGPEQVGGWSKADVVISEESIDYPMLSSADVLIAMSQEGYDMNLDVVKKGGLIIYDSDLVKVKSDRSKRCLGLPATRIAENLGRRIVANIVMLGAFSELSGIIKQESLARVIRKRFPKAIELNERALSLGIQYAREVLKDG